MKRLGFVLPLLLAWTAASAAAPDGAAALKNTGALDRLVKGTGVYHLAPKGRTPGFVADPSWPQPLPHNWILGQIGGLYVDPHDHIWVYNRPRTLSNDEAGLEGAVPGAVDLKGAAGQWVGQCAAQRPRAPIAAGPRPRCWSSTLRASCCAPGAVRPIRASCGTGAGKTRLHLAQP